MPEYRAPTWGKFRPEQMFRPRSIAILGAGSPTGRQLRANLEQGGFEGTLQAVETVAELVAPPDLAVLAALDGPVLPVFQALAALGTRGVAVACMADGVGEAARATGIRALGPGSFGVVVPKWKLNLSRAHIAPPPGRLALVSQSAALCRVVLDWATPNGVGFSTIATIATIAGIGGNADVGFGLVLDWFSRDADTGAILLDIRHLRDPRRFISAARAAARLRPIVALHAGTRLADPDGLMGATFEAVLRRCGVLGVESLADLLAAAETLTRARPARSEALAIVTNAIGPAQLAADAVLRDGLTLADLAPETRAVVELTFPAAFGTRAADAVPGSRHIAYAGPDESLRLAELAALLAGAPEVGGVLLVHAPTGPGDAAAMAALGAAAGAMKVPLLVCAMGQSTGEAHRRTLAEAGVPAFATPEEAVRGFRHLVQHRRIRAAARELPNSAVPDLAIDSAAAASALEGAGQGDPAPLLAAYGIGMGTSQGAVALRVALAEDAMFGPVLAFGQGGPAGGLRHDFAVDLPPLNPALASGLVAQTGVAAEIATIPGGAAAVADLLVRVSQLAVEQPHVASLELDPIHLDAAGLRVGAARITLRHPGRGPLAIPPYPTEWIHHHDASGQPIVIRPVRPEDAEAHEAFFARLSPEDVRYRFFSAIRALSAEQIGRLTQVDYEREMALLAVRPAAPGALAGETVGVARLVREMDSGEAEFAVVVQGDAKGAGIASALMRQLLDWGRSKGVREVVGQILADNAPMRAFIRRLGFKVKRCKDDADIMEARLALEPPPAP